VTPIIPCPVLVGRGEELGVLLGALDAASSGAGSIAFVVGEAGIGKSRLVHEVAAIARDRGDLVLRGRAVPGSTASAYRPLSEALASVAVHTHDEDVRPWAPALTGVLPTLDVERSGTDLNDAVRGEAVLRLLRAACRDRVGLVVIEDLHWADPETVAVVEHLSDNLARAPVLVVVTSRTDVPGSGGELVRRISARRSSPILPLSRLDEAGVTSMVHSCLDGRDPRAIHRIVELCDGVPFLVEELLVLPGLPTSFTEGVAARLGGLSERDRRVVLTAAAYGRQFDWRLLPAATGLPETEVVDSLERAVEVQLLMVDGDGFRFRHALTAEAVFESVVPPRRTVLAAAALAALDSSGSEPSAERRDVAARVAERAGDTARAGRLLLAAGEDALAHGALNTAVLTLERAAQLSTGEDVDRVNERLVEALALAGRVDDALHVGGVLVDRLPMERAAAMHLRLAGAAITAARWDLAAEELVLARPLVEDAATPALRADLALRDADLAVGRSDLPSADLCARAALDIARQDSLPEVECAALQLLGRSARRESLEAAAAWFHQSLTTAEVHHLTLWRLRALHELGTIALLDRSDVDQLLEAKTLALSLGAMATAAVLDIEIAAGFNGLHDLDAEARHGREAARLGSELGLAMIAAYGWLHVAGAAALTGDQDQLVTAAAAARAAVPPGIEQVDGLLVGACDVLAAMATNDTERALASAERSSAILRQSAAAPPAHFRAAYPLLLAVAHRSEAIDEVEELEAAGLSVSRPGRGGLAMTRAVVVGWTDAGTASQLAIDADSDLTYTPLWQCLVRRYAAEAATADGWAIPDGWLADAESWLRGHGYDRAAQACRALRARTDPVPQGWARLGVSAREADVLQLVIEGLSNREIADQLHLSVRTVEKHVEALLRKTATTSRTKLARLASTT
jgi:DNA-binding CsgD family transcriptional regulator